MEIQNNKKDLYQTVDPFNPRSLFALTSAFYQSNKPIVILLKSTMHSRGLLHTFYFSHVHITAYLMSGFLLVAPSSKGQAFLFPALLFIIKAPFLVSSRVTWVPSFGQVCICICAGVVKRKCRIIYEYSL